MNKKYFFLIFVPILFFQSYAFSKIVTGAVSAALGNAGAGQLEISDGAWANPALIALFPSKHMGLSFTENQQQIHFADNGSDALFPASLGYSQMKFPSSNSEIEQKNYHLALAYPFFNKNASLGIDFQYRQWNFKTSDLKYNQTIADIGAFFLITEWFSAGAVLRDQAITNTDLSDSIDQATTALLGIGVGDAAFARFRFDVGTVANQSSQNWIYRAGLQTVLNDWILTRIGYENNNVQATNVFTVGVGFAGPQFGFHYAYQSEANDKFSKRHVVDLSVPF